MKKWLTENCFIFYIQVLNLENKALQILKNK